MADRLSDDLRLFIARNIQSIQHLEVLLHVRAHATSAHTGTSVARNLLLNARSTAEILVSLERRGFVRATTEGYEYAAAAAVDAIVHRVHAAYSERRVAVVDVIYGDGNETSRDRAGRKVP